MQTVVKDLLPQRTRWSQRAVARHLCSDKNTVKTYIYEIAIFIPDFLRECPRNLDGSVQSGFPLSQYQAWTLCKLIALGRTIKNDLNGTAYRKVVKSTALKMSYALSKESFQRETGSQVA